MNNGSNVPVGVESVPLPEKIVRLADRAPARGAIPDDMARVIVSERMSSHLAARDYRRNLAVARIEVREAGSVRHENIRAWNQPNGAHAEGRVIDQIDAMRVRLGSGAQVEITHFYTERIPCTSHGCKWQLEQKKIPHSRIYYSVEVADGHRAATIKSHYEPHRRRLEGSLSGRETQNRGKTPASRAVQGTAPRSTTTRNLYSGLNTVPVHRANPSNIEKPNTSYGSNKFYVAVRSIRSLGIELLIDYAIDKVRRWLFGDPIEKALREHIKLLSEDIDKAIQEKSRTIDHYTKEMPGRTIYTHLVFNYSIGWEAPKNFSDPFFIGMQLSDVYIHLESYKSASKKSGWPDSINETWKGRRLEDFYSPFNFEDISNKGGRRRLEEVETISFLTSQALEFSGDIGGTWMAGRAIGVNMNYSLWAVFTFTYEEDFLVVEGYTVGQNHNRPSKSLDIAITYFYGDFLDMDITQEGVPLTLHLHLDISDRFIGGTWTAEPHKNHPNPKEMPREGTELWFRPKDHKLQRGLRRRMMHRDGVNPKYREELEKWRAGKFR